jgi:hypothetical protein
MIGQYLQNKTKVILFISLKFFHNLNMALVRRRWSVHAGTPKYRSIIIIIIFLHPITMISHHHRFEQQLLMLNVVIRVEPGGSTTRHHQGPRTVVQGGARQAAVAGGRSNGWLGAGCAACVHRWRWTTPTQPRLWRPRRAAAALRDSQFTPLRASRSPTRTPSIPFSSLPRCAADCIHPIHAIHITDSHPNFPRASCMQPCTARLAVPYPPLRLV